VPRPAVNSQPVVALRQARAYEAMLADFLARQRGSPPVSLPRLDLDQKVHSDLLAICRVVHPVVACSAECSDPVDEVDVGIDVVCLEVWPPVVRQPSRTTIAELACATEVDCAQPHQGRCKVGQRALELGVRGRARAVW
jgi:hypothetical protein